MATAFRDTWKGQLACISSINIAACIMYVCKYKFTSCTLPVTSCSSERSHSSLKLIKTSIHSTMANERLSGLALLYIHRDIPTDIPDVIEEFSCRHPRKLRLSKNKLLDLFLTICF